MKEIVVLSGKGGVGKSSITAAVGQLLAEKYRIVLADTDVDAPNLHLVLGAELESTHGISASDKAFIDYDICSRCLQCVEVCRFSSIIGEDEPIIISYSCEGCGACSLVCPLEAISIQPVENGKLNILHSDRIRVVSGELTVGESSSGRLVDAVKRRAREEAESNGSDLLLTDGPPGIGCPVIASLKGVDYAVLVTEPTPSALSDLKRAYEVTRFFKVAVGVVLNRSDIHEGSKQALLSFLRENDLDLLVEIPYDPLLPEALGHGETAVTMYPEAPSSIAIRQLSKSLDNLVAGESEIR
jgi:MinD superfamily P-loop ATPase